MGILISTHVVVLDATVLGFHTPHTKGLGGLGTMSQCHGMMREEHLEKIMSFGGSRSSRRTNKLCAAAGFALTGCGAPSFRVKGAKRPEKLYLKLNLNDEFMKAS